MDKLSRYSESVKEKPSSIIVEESVEKGLNAFAAELLKYTVKNGIEPVAEFLPVPMKSSWRGSRARSWSKMKDEDGSVEKGKRQCWPVFHLRFENGRKWDSLKEIHSKDREIPIPLLDALNFAMEKYNRIAVLKLENCRINAFGVTIIAKILVEIGCVKDLNLDMNPNAKENFHLLCSPVGNLAYLSLRLCEISDSGVERIAGQLKYQDPPYSPKLLALNLANNRMTEIGAGHIARMLRTNRSLKSLVLCGNRINDAGASLIIHQLSMSTLIHSEIVEKRRRRFAELLSEEENRVREKSGKLSQEDHWTIIKPRKKSSLSQRSKKSVQPVPSAILKTDDYSLNSARTPTYEVGEFPTVSAPAPAPTVAVGRSPSLYKSGTLVAAQLPEMEAERHPFNSETFPLESVILARGNFQLQHLNFSFCGLTAKSLKRLIECLYYQTYMGESDTSRGLLHVSLEGNSFPETLADWLKLNELLRLRCARKSASSMEDYKELVPREAPLLRDAIKQRGSLINQ